MGKSGDVVEVSTQNFSRGLVTVKPGHLLEEGETPSCSNVDFSRQVGRVTKRRGYSVLVSANLGAGNPVKGLYEYIKADGTTTLFATTSTIIWEVTAPSTWTKRYQQGGQAVTNVSDPGGNAPVIVTVTAHGYSNGDSVVFYGTETGTSILQTGSAYLITVTGADTFTLDGTVTTVVTASAQTTLYVARTSGSPNALGNVNFATFGDKCIAVSSTLTTLKSTGGAFTALLGTPPANVKYIKSHRNRLWLANSSAGKSRLSYSALANVEDWTTSGDAGYVDIGPDDGEQITGLASVGPSLIVFKQNSTWVVKNGSPSTFQVQKIGSVGCVAPRSIVECDTFALFLSNFGVYSASQNGVALMSYNIQPDFDSMSNSTKALAVGGRLRTQYWLSVDSDADNINDTAYILDYVYGTWGKYSNKKENVYYTRQDGTLISGGHDTDVIRKHDDTENDNGSAITMTYDSPDYEFGEWARRKQMHDIILKTNAVTGKTIVVSHIIDGTTQSSTKTFNLDAVLSGNDEVIHKFYHPPDTSYGLTIRLRFTNSETSAAVQIFGFSTRAKLRERENG